MPLWFQPLASYNPLISTTKIKTTKQFKERYKKGIGVLEEIKLGSINKEGLLKKELSKRDIGGAPAKLLRVISFPN